MDSYIFEVPEKFTPGRIRVEERDDDLIKSIFEGTRYIAGYETVEDGKPNLHYHIMVAGLLDPTVRKRIQRFGEGRPGAHTWTKEDKKQPEYYTFSGGVAYSIKDGQWWGSDAGIEAYAKLLPAYVKPADRSKGPPKDNSDRKKLDWMLSERNIRRLYHHHKHNVAPRADGVYDFFDVLAWIGRNTNWKANRSFLNSITKFLVQCCESNDDGDAQAIQICRDRLVFSAY